MFNKIAKNKHSDIYPIMSDSYSYVITQLAEHEDKTLFISNDDANLESIAKQIEFFSPNKRVLVLPSWDCSPYDKISPNISNLSKRINALSELLSNQDNLILLTSINSLMQRLMPAQALLGACKTIKIGDSIKRDDFLLLLVQLSFRRVEVASEPGDFAVRGDIIDIISDVEQGWRMDFFGNKLEKIRIFDPVTQISNGQLERINLMPSSEVILNTESIANFCENFIQYFGEYAEDNPLYEAIKNGRKYPGMEHYLPCFYEKLDNIFDYFSPNQVIYENDFDLCLKKHLISVKEHYVSRKDLLTNRFLDEVIYYPVEPQTMWLSLEELSLKLNQYRHIKLHNFATDLAGSIDLKLKKMDDFDLLASSKKVSAFDLFKKYRDDNKLKIIVACNSEGSSARIKNILENYNIHWYQLNKFEEYKNISGKTVGITILPIDHGFSVDSLAIVTEQDLLGEKIIRKKSTKTIETLMEEINNLQIGEYVVHKQHGIGLFSGLETIKAAGIEHDCIKIIYDGGDILYIPVENLDLLTRYGSSEETIRLDKLGGISWSNRKAKLKEKLKEIAAQLIKTAALRASREGEYLSPISGSYEEFCKRFNYIETDDQMNSINDVVKDLASGIPMDRLICGDVGFGKTEVAMRAAFIATNPENNIKQQVAIIVPTTLLARQHYHSFFKRFSGFNTQVKQVSRLVHAKEIRHVKEGLKDGSVDIVIGTHALLSKDIEFKNLGLLIVDEEQRFGVTQKEKLKTFKENIHILTLSATPIPRTLQMSLTGVRDLSIIATPPVDRQVVKTYIMPFDSVVIREAIMREFYRGGQSFFVCPRISDISEILPKLTELVPEIKIVVAHGQMSPNALEEIMNDFYNKKFHLLLSTSIVESGIDISEANTMIIYRADKFGLSALYQLRGRVGRSNIKAFSYLLLPNKKLSKLAMARLEVMQTLDTLGAGFTVASHDMDIRGFGNLVGDEQSGHIREVGLELYQQMLKDAILALKNPAKAEEDLKEEYSPQINLGIPVILPEDYVADLNLRLSLYRTLAGFKAIKEVDQFAVELIDRFGKYPVEVEHLLLLIKLKIKAKQINVEKIDAGPKAITFAFRENKCLHPEELLDFISKNQSYLKIRPDQKLLISKEFLDIKQKIQFIDELLEKLDFS
jgi:transcription-repair coupling factor (superfamily II helicase)